MYGYIEFWISGLQWHLLHKISVWDILSGGPRDLLCVGDQRGEQDPVPGGAVQRQHGRWRS